ncbi:unnamed protein product, partial [Rangifer tarandus platyrhynchus]
AHSAPDVGQVCSAHTPTPRRGPRASLLPPGEIHPGANPRHRDNPSFLSAVKYLESRRPARRTARPTGHRPDLDHHRVPAPGPGPRCCRPVTHGGPT